MSALDKLTFAPKTPKAVGNVFILTKNLLMLNLERQIRAAETLVTGEVLPDSPTRKWYYRRGDGKVGIQLRIGLKIQEWPDDKEVVVEKDEEVAAALKTILDAVKGGEVDDMIREAIASRPARKRRGRPA